MASETVSSDHSTVPEKLLEKEVHEELKTMEENVPQPKVSEEKAKEKEVQSGTTPSAEAEEKIKEKESEPPKVEEVVKAEVEEKPKAEEPTIAITSVEPQEKIEEKQTEAPVAEENKKLDDVPVPNNAEMTKDSVPEVIKSESEGQPKVKDVEKPQEESTKESVVEHSKEIEIPESAIAVVDKKEDLPEKNEILESVAETVEAKEGQPAEFLEKVEIPESTTETVDVKELLNKTEIPESVIAESKEVQPKELPPKEPEIEGVKVPTAEDKKEKAPESANETVGVKELLNKTEIPESVIAESKEVQPEELPPKEPETEGVKDVEVAAAEDKKEKAPESATETIDVKELLNKTEIPESVIVESKDLQPEELLPKEPETEGVKDVEVASAEDKKEKAPESATETVDVKELLNKTEIPESVIVESKEMQPEELLPKEPEIEGVKDVEVAAAEDKKEKAPESATETVDVKELLNKTEIPESVIVESKEMQPEELLPKEPEIEGVKDVEVAAAEDKKEKAPESATESVDVKELLNKTEIPESVIVESKEMQPEELLPKEPEIEGVQVPAPVSAPEVKDKPEETPEIPALVEDKSSGAEPAEMLEAETTKDKEIPADETKDTKVADEVAIAEPVAKEISDQANSTPEEVHIVEKDVEVPAPVESTVKIVAEDKEEEVAKTETEEPVKVEEKIEKDEKIEEKEEKTAIVEDSTQPEVKGVEDIPVTISQEAGKIIEKTSREIEFPAENGSKVVSNETPKDVEIEKKVDVEEPQKAEMETKEEEPVETKLEQEEKEVKESATTTTDAPIEEPTKETQELKTVTETPIKKQSNNLLAKVKQSLVKAKKAITGKSQSKSPPSETKDEVKAT